MAKLNRSVIIANVNKSLAERGADVRIRYSSEWREFQVTYTHKLNARTYAPADSLTGAIYTALDILNGAKGY